MTIRDEMAKVIAGENNRFFCLPENGEIDEYGMLSDSKNNYRKTAQAVLDMPQIQALVDAVEWFLTDNSDSGEVYAIQAMQKALAPFTEVRGK
jgi:hypothetical protein